MPNVIFTAGQIDDTDEMLAFVNAADPVDIIAKYEAVADVVGRVVGSRVTNVTVTRNVLSVTYSNGTVERFTVSGGTPPPVVTTKNFLGISVSGTFISTDFTVEGNTPGLVVPSSTGRVYVAYAKPESEGDFSHVYIYAASNPNALNQITAWEQLTSPILLGGVSHLILKSLDSLRNTSGLTIEAG